MKASSIMISDVVTLREDDSMRTALEYLGKKRIRVIPVVDGSRHVKGVITSRALLKGALPKYITSGDYKRRLLRPRSPKLLRAY